MLFVYSLEMLIVIFLDNFSGANPKHNLKVNVKIRTQTVLLNVSSMF